MAFSVKMADADKDATFSLTLNSLFKWLFLVEFYLVFMDSSMVLGYTNCVKGKSYCECDSDGILVDLKKILPSTASDFEFSHTGQKLGVYRYNPCYKLKILDPSSLCKNALMCQEKNGVSWELAVPPNIMFEGTVQAKNLSIHYTHQESGSIRTTVVRVVCDKSLKVTTFTGPGEGKELHYDFVLSTSDAIICDPVKSGLSTGSILVIIFFVVSIVYVVGGMLFMAFNRGASGKEICPNLSFWTEVPLLVRDGACFAVKCGKTDDTYNQI